MTGDFAGPLVAVYRLGRLSSGIDAPGGGRMPFHNVVMPETLAMLTKVLDQHCENHDFGRASLEREEAASFLLLLFSNGVQSAGRLKTALEVRKRARDNPSNYRWRTRTEAAARSAAVSRAERPKIGERTH